MVWPFKQKMTVDYCASLYAQAIKEDIAVYKDAVKNHAAENVTKEQIEALEPELWALDLAVLDVVLFLSKFPPEMSKKLIPMLVVGYSPIEKDAYIKKSHYYGRALESSPSEQMTIELGKAFVATSGIKYQSERTNVNEKALEWAIGTVATGSLQGLGKFTADILRKYTIY